MPKLPPPCASPLRGSSQRSRRPENPGSYTRNRICCLYADMQCTPWLFSVATIRESCQFDPGLFLDALQGSYRYISLRMRHRHAAFFPRMLELFVAADMVHLVPTIPFQFFHDVPAIHESP